MNTDATDDLTTCIGRYMDTAPFWAGTREGRLMLQYCTRTQRYQFYPRPTSIHAGRRSTQWREASGRASLAAWTVDRLSPLAAEQSPRIHALVDLEEGVRLLTWLVDTEPADLGVGLALDLRWVTLARGLRWPAFTPHRTTS